MSGRKRRWLTPEALRSGITETEAWMSNGHTYMARLWFCAETDDYVVTALVTKPGDDQFPTGTEVRTFSIHEARKKFLQAARALRARSARGL